jgi:hypothetical protein
MRQVYRDKNENKSTVCVSDVVFLAPIPGGATEAPRFDNALVQDLPLPLPLR